MVYYLLVETSECCTEPECPSNGRVTGLLVTDNPDAIRPINPYLSSLGSCDESDAQYESLAPLPKGKLITLEEASVLSPQIADWWQDV